MRIVIVDEVARDAVTVDASCSCNERRELSSASLRFVTTAMTPSRWRSQRGAANGGLTNATKAGAGRALWGWVLSSGAGCSLLGLVGAPSGGYL